MTYMLSQRLLSAARRGLVIAFLTTIHAPAWALELLVVERSNCPYCKIFDSEVANGYDKTEIGERAPLRRYNISDAWPDDLENVRVEKLTPSFILVHEGKEVGRLRGYPGKEEFWQLLNMLMEKHDAQ